MRKHVIQNFRDVNTDPEVKERERNVREKDTKTGRFVSYREFLKSVSSKSFFLFIQKVQESLN